MTENQHPEPFGDAAGRAGREIRTMASTVTILIGAYMRHHAQEEQKKALRDEREKQAAAARERAERDAVRARWAPARDRGWLRSADIEELARTWAAAAPYADPAGDLYERSAELAADNCEARLRDLHPYAMNHYDRLRADGVGRREAMHQASPLFLNHPNARPQEPAHRLGIAAQGVNPQPVGEMHDPSRGGFEQHLADTQTARGSRIVDNLQSQALASGRPLLSTEEQRTALGNATNLSPEIIGRVVRPSADAPPPPRRPWQNESPFSIEEVVAYAAQHPDALAGPAPRPTATTRAQDRARHV